MELSNRCRGLETKLQHCLIGSDIFADQTKGTDGRMQFSASPNGKIREVSEAKKRALQVGCAPTFDPGWVCLVEHGAETHASRVINVQACDGPFLALDSDLGSV